MKKYPMEYLNDVVENQGKLFDYVSEMPIDFDYFVSSYMNSKTRKSIDEGKAYVITMDYRELWNYFSETESFIPKEGKKLEGFMPEWIGEFYAYYQWYYSLSSEETLKKVPLSFLKNAYYGLHDLGLELATKKVGETK